MLSAIAGCLVMLAGSLRLPLLLANPAVRPESLSVFDAASPPAANIRDFFVLVLAVTGAIFIVVEGMLIYCILRFRQSPADPGTEPPQIYGSKPIEVAWTLAPVLVVFVLFLVVYRTSADVRTPPPGKDALHVTVVGHQWWWEYRYPGEGIITANELHVPTDRPVVFDLESADVIHSFWIPRLAGKTDVVPNKLNQTWFIVPSQNAGLYLGQCAEYCGTQHANMMLRVIAEPPEEFQKWVANQQKPAESQTNRKRFLALACQNCHTIRGTEAKGKFGPDLTHLMSRQTLVTGIVPNDKANLTKWVDNPALIKPGCLMPSMHLSPKEIDEVVAYLLSLN